MKERNFDYTWIYNNINNSENWISSYANYSILLLVLTNTLLVCTGANHNDRNGPDRHVYHNNKAHNHVRYRDHSSGQILDCNVGQCHDYRNPTNSQNCRLVDALHNDRWTQLSDHNLMNRSNIQLGQSKLVLPKNI